MSAHIAKMVARLAYLTAVLLGGGWLYATAYHFEGMLALVPGKAERTIATTRGQGGLAAKFMPGVPPELLDARNPKAYERALDPASLYVTAKLPFSVELDRAEVLEERPPTYIIERRFAGKTSELIAQPGTVVPWSGGEARLSEVRAWLGLVRTPNATPMAALSVRRGAEAWTRGIFLREGLWRDIEGETGLLLRWWRTEDDARARFPERIGPFFGARWGALDGGAVNWFAAFTPGTGATLADDTEITLLEVDPEHDGGPAILVSRKPKNALEERRWYTANATEPIRLELPGNYPSHVLINASQDGAAWLASYREGVRGEVVRLQEGASAEMAAKAPFTLRLDAVMQSAAPSISQKGQEVQEVVLETSAGEISLREGAMRADDAGAQLRFRRMPQPPRVRYHLTLTESKATSREAKLTLGESLRQGNWTISFTDEVPAPTQLAVLHATRTAFTPMSTAGALLFFAACYGFVISRALMQRRRYSSSDASFAPPAPPDEADTGDTDNAVS